MIRILRAKEWTHRRLINRGSNDHEKTKIDGAIHPLIGLCFQVVDQVDARLHLSVRSGAIPVPHPG